MCNTITPNTLTLSNMTCLVNINKCWIVCLLFCHRFCLHLHLSATTSNGVAPDLQIIETNPFRHLTHISLRLIPASDSYLKKYLAQTILAFKV